MKDQATAIVLATLLGWTTGFSVYAADSVDQRFRHTRLRLTEMTVTGKVAKNIWTDKDGSTRANFIVITPAGDKTRLVTGTRAEDGQPTPSQLEKFMDKVITVVGKGYTMDENNGQTVTYIVSVARILVVDPDAGR